jgi:hypothetical protein
VAAACCASAPLLPLPPQQPEAEARSACSMLLLPLQPQPEVLADEGAGEEDETFLNCCRKAAPASALPPTSPALAAAAGAQGRLGRVGRWTGPIPAALRLTTCMHPPKRRVARKEAQPQLVITVQEARKRDKVPLMSKGLAEVMADKGGHASASISASLAGDRAPPIPNPAACEL